MKSPARKSVLDGLIRPDKNTYCHISDLNNEASVEHFFLSRLLPDLGYSDAQIKTKQSIDVLAVGRGRKKEKYKPDYVLFFQGLPRCVIDAKGIDENPDDWIEQCGSYCLLLNRKYGENKNPVRYFVLSNGIKTICYKWDNDTPLLELDFGDFQIGNPKYEHLKAILGYETISKSEAKALKLGLNDFRFERLTTVQARRLFKKCHDIIWKSEGYGPGPAFAAFVKLMFVKLWADKTIRQNAKLSHLFVDSPRTVNLPADVVTFSMRWIKDREAESMAHPINDMFVRIRSEFEKEIVLGKKKRVFDKHEDLGLRPDTVKSVIEQMEHADLFGIDEDLNGRFFETFLNATMRGRELGQYFTRRSVVKLMTRLADLKASKDRVDTVIDGCCGSGGFLIEALSEMRERIRENNSFSNEEKAQLIDTVANDCIYGIDYGKIPPLARVARINMYLHGDGGSHIYYADTLDKEIDNQAQTDPEIVQNMLELRGCLSETLFDVVLTNPPFSMKRESKNPSELRILKQYDIARRSDKTDSLRPSLRSSIMFFERYYDMLKSGGRLLTVIDESLLSSDDFGYVRDFIRRRFLIRGIISLPGDTFKLSGSRVKTSVLILEKKRSKNESQPNWFHYFGLHVGIDDLPQKASEYDVRQAREKADRETDLIVDEYKRYQQGHVSDHVLGAECILDRLDLRNCVPNFGRLRGKWKAEGIAVKKLSDLVSSCKKNIDLSAHPNESFKLLKVSYEGYCEVETEKQGKHVRHKSMLVVKEGQLVFSLYNGHNGAVGIAPHNLSGAVVPQNSYAIFDCHEENGLRDMAYLQSVLRSHEVRADIQSVSVGSGRYKVSEQDIGSLWIPWLTSEKRREIGHNLLTLWNEERRLELRKRESTAHLKNLGVESESSRERWEASKPPK